MNKQTLIRMGILALTVFLGFTMASRLFADDMNTRSIRVYGGDSYSSNTLKIEPELLRIDKGDIVVWRNWARARELKIVFEEEKMCEDVVQASVAFNIDAKRCFVTSWIPLGGTSSLRFTKMGRYNYTLETPGGAKATGEVLVTAE